MKQKIRIFLSYAAEQHAVAEQIYWTLTNAGHDVFFDRTSLLPGRDYNPSILAEIRSSELFIFLISPQSLQQGAYTRTELRFARDVWPSPEGHVVPAMVEDVGFDQIPNYLKAITILRPEGSLPAELAAAVQDLISKTPREDTLAGQKIVLNELRQREKLRELDEQWEQNRKRFLITFQGKKEPSKYYAWATFVVWLAMSTMAFLGNIALGFAVLGIGVFQLLYILNKAALFTDAKSEYESKQSRILRQIKAIDDQTTFHKLSRDDLIKLGNKITSGNGTEEELQRCIELFDRNVPHPDGSALFFYPENYTPDENDISGYEPTVEEVVDKALGYRPSER